MKNLHHTPRTQTSSFDMEAMLARGRRERSRAFHDFVRTTLDLLK